MMMMMMMIIIIKIIIILSEVTVLWNQQVRTDKLFPNNKLRIITRETCMLIDVAIAGDRNVIKKEAEKILKCKDLIIEIQRMCNVKSKVIPVIIWATGNISKSLRQYLSNIPGKHEIKELQTHIHICHCTQTAVRANVKVQNIFHGRYNIACSTNCKYRTAATLYTVETRFVSDI